MPIKDKPTYYSLNKERIQQKAILKANSIKEYKANYRRLNVDKIKAGNKKYYVNNVDTIRKTQQNYKKNRLLTDSLFKLREGISTLIRNSFKNNSFKKSSKTVDILGCSINDLKTFLESKFEPWMNWDNRGLYNGQPNYGWDIDHIFPTSSAKTEEEVIKVNHYSNLQPLCSYVNRNKKRNKIIE